MVGEKVLGRAEVQTKKMVQASEEDRRDQRLGQRLASKNNNWV